MLPSTLPSPEDRAPKRPSVRRSCVPVFPKGDRTMVPLAGGKILVEAFPWTGGLTLWTQDENGRWVSTALRR